MTIVTQTLSNGNEVKYKIVNGTAYHLQTPDRVVEILERARQSRKRIRIFLGDNINGLDWMEEYDTMGVISRSTGKIAIPLLIKNKRSSGGGALLDHCIIKITIDGVVAYQHPSYHQPVLEYRPVNLEFNGRQYTAGVFALYQTGAVKNVANFNSQEKAKRWIEFMQGKRNSK